MAKIVFDSQVIVEYRTLVFLVPLIAIISFFAACGYATKRVFDHLDERQQTKRAALQAKSPGSKQIADASIHERLALLEATVTDTDFELNKKIAALPAPEGQKVDSNVRPT